ncbi:uncharacterized protein BDR25DRAFT_386431 [Lindgomyces ingoldianus]|uniref:Uncharacterized protein n=1 Tax=Lindgomyces ingoldianus TaxID=673940 RepID=A0ACB6R2Z3_9PLEO|nr:uncharacterized protein BDR25DRAFT_386431 [Lindgomyces ingoldianus]KAF2473619.1 hypothetical protein BDR25DRAFT_386431 [Lindgomyces ingoldianus]
MRVSALLSTAIFTATVLAHGNVTSPPSRQPGAAMQKVCGAPAVAAILADGTGPLENIPSNGAANCNIFMCKGAQFADNQANVQQFTAGEIVNFEVQLPIPHEGPANVSIIDTATNTVVGPPLIEFDSYADENLAVLPLNNTAFSVTMPANLGAKCAVAGECVMQWFWFGTAAVQTYENCVDFVMV